MQLSLLTEVEADGHLSWESHPQENWTFKQITGWMSESVVINNNRAASKITSLIIIYGTMRFVNTNRKKSVSSDQS